MAFFVISWLEFPSVTSFKIFTTHCIQRDTDFRSWICKGIFFFDFCKFMSFTAVKKTGHIDFPEKRAPTKVKYLLPVCHCLRIFTERNARKVTVSFAFYAHVVGINHRKTLTFAFERAQI